MITQSQLNDANDVIALFGRFGIWNAWNNIAFIRNIECDPKYVRNNRY